MREGSPWQPPSDADVLEALRPRVNAAAIVDRRPSPYRTSYPLEEISIRLQDGSTLDLIFKDLSRRRLTESAARAKPAFLYDPLREIEVYRSLLGPYRIEAPTYYESSVDPRCDRYWLFLERMYGIEMYQVGNFDIWKWAAGRLVSLQEALAVGSRPEELPDLTAHLLVYDVELYRRWMRRALEFSKGRPDAEQAAIRWLASCYQRVVTDLDTLPRSVIHGELYASNVLVMETHGMPRIAPLDWEMAALAPPLIDLAALIAGRWSEEEKRDMALTYYRARPHDAYQDEGAFFRALDLCRLHLAVQWLGWSEDWIPPKEHRQDWLAEALMVAERLGL